MTEIQAWEFCARVWSKIKSDPEFDSNEDHGICHTIERLVTARKLTHKQWDKMDDKIRVVKKEPSSNRHWPYCWEGSLKGAKQRVAFCKAQIKKLKAKKKK